MHHVPAKYHVPTLIAFLYFFCNTWLLPNGLFYTTLLTPVFFYNSVTDRIYKPYLYFLLLSLVYFLVHLQHGISYTDYFKSWLFTLLNISFLVSVYTFFSGAADEQIYKLFRRLVYANFILVAIAALAYMIPFERPVFWYIIPITEGSGNIPRLKMLTSEASIYSLIFSPLVLFFFCHELLYKHRLSISFFLLLLLPLALSFSLGVLASLFIAVFLTVFWFRSIFFQNRALVRFLLWSILLLSAGIVCLYLFKRDNLLFLRISNIFSGKDTSARGRTYEAFELARRVLNPDGLWWTGLGPGQFKLAGKTILLSYYKYSGNVGDIRIPNAAADTLVVYGMVGLLLRLFLQLFFFFRTRVYHNVFRFALFAFLFLYQFTGSYYNNLLELTIWVLIFSKAFSLFNKASLQSHVIRFPA